ncbi:MAG: DegT/DnrJ/EryC1/StrS family aminotransferase [Phycisphaerales bacterium]
MGSAWLSLNMLLRPSYAAGVQLVPAYEQAFSRTILGTGAPALAFGRGRVALWAILRALAVGETSEVIVPAYTCETVPMAVKFAGARCVYTDVGPGGYNSSAGSVGEALTNNSAAVICQHTYGIRQPIRQWIASLAPKGVPVIEDRCHVIGNGSCEDRGSVAGQAVYFSTHFSKPFSTGQGGLAVFTDERLCAEVERIRDRFSRRHDRKRARTLALQTLLYSMIVRPATRAVVGGMFRWAQRCGLIRGTVSADEYGRTMPADYLSRATNVHAVLGMRQLLRWPRDCEHRRRLTQFYLEHLAVLGVDTRPLIEGDRAGALLMVPVLVEDKQDVLRRAAGRSLPIGTWFDRPPAHLRTQSAGVYDYVEGQCPRAEYLVSREVHLLTSPWVDLDQAKRAMDFLDRHAVLASPFESAVRTAPIEGS